MDSIVFVGTTLFDVYAKCSMIKDALKVFRSMPDKSAVTWSSIIAGCEQNNLFEEGLLLFIESIQWNRDTLSLRFQLLQVLVQVCRL